MNHKTFRFHKAFFHAMTVMFSNTHIYKFFNVYVLKLLKDAMSVSFDLNCLHLTF